jgi:hypothetical protein
MKWATLFLLPRLFGFVAAIGQRPTVGFVPSNNALKLASLGNAVQIIIDSGDWKGVHRAAQDLAHDFGRVTGTNGTIDFKLTNARASNNSQPGSERVAIIAGTLTKSPIIDGLVKSGKIDADAIYDKWEAFTSTIVESPAADIHRALVIAG